MLKIQKWINPVYENMLYSVKCVVDFYVQFFLYELYALWGSNINMSFVTPSLLLARQFCTYKYMCVCIKL